MRAVAYVRVSSEEQVYGTSLDSQVKACIEYALRQGIHLTEDDIFREEGVSAKIMDRPKLAALLKHCTESKGKVQYCIVWKVDRLARRSEYHHIIKAQLAKVGVKLISVTEPIGDDPTGNLMESMLAAFAQFDNDIRTLRTTQGMKARTEQGGWPHQPPYGYRKKRLPSGAATLVPDAIEGPVMAAMLEKFATGDFTIKQMADEAYRLGVRNRKGEKRGWESIKWLLVNPLYAGFVKTKLVDGRLIKGLHEPLISEHTYYRIMAIVNGDIVKYGKHAELEWPLRGGFLIHSTCGKAITASAPRGRNGPSPRYHCMGGCKAAPGRHVSKRREDVHDDFMALMSRVKPKEGVAQLFKEIVLRRWNEEFKEAVVHNARLKDEIGACNQKRARVIDLFIDGRLTEQEKATKLAEIDADIARFQIQSIEADEYAAQKEAVMDGALLFMSDAGAFWNLGSIEVKKRVQDAIFPEGLVYDFDEGFGTAKLADSYLLITKIADENADDLSMARVTLTNWNQVKSELIEMWKVTQLVIEGISSTTKGS